MTKKMQAKFDSCMKKLYKSSTPLGNWSTFKNDPSFNHTNYTITREDFEKVISGFKGNLPERDFFNLRLEITMGPSPIIID